MHIEVVEPMPKAATLSVSSALEHLLLMIAMDPGTTGKVDRCHVKNTLPHWASQSNYLMIRCFRRWTKRMARIASVLMKSLKSWQAQFLIAEQKIANYDCIISMMPPITPMSYDTKSNPLVHSIPNPMVIPQTHNEVDRRIMKP